MLGKRTRPAIGKLPDVEKNNRFSSDGMASPKSPLDLNTKSPRGLKNSNLGGGVGLGIVAALDKSDSGHVPIKFVLGNLNLNRSDPIPIGSGAKGSVKCRENIQIQKPEVPEMGCWDEYTCVTSHQPNNTFTKVYFDGGEDFLFDPWMNSRTLRQSSSPPRFEEFPTSDFLSSCHLCRKKLDGKDIYMYRGEKAFCSTECRYKQIISDERKEKCKSEVSRSMDISVSPYSGGQLFSTGIFAV